MTDNEIIKALECCCGDNNDNEECSEHICYQAVLPEERNGVTRWCRQWLIKDALDLINHQKAEIVKLEKVEKYADKTIKAQEAEIERYKCVIKILEKDVMNAKSEAMKYLAEDIKQAFYYEFDELIPSIMSDKIDELVNERVCKNDNGRNCKDA